MRVPAKNFNWTCPHCEHAVTISEEATSEQAHYLGIENADGDRILDTRFIVCPNMECRRFSLTAALYKGSVDKSGGTTRSAISLMNWSLVPQSKAKNFPSYVPQAILEDYREACLIQDLSPKASATLSRRSLQGILRDFWKVKPGRLVDEIKEIEGKVDSETWRAIDAVRKIGNIGAHMEKDISVIVDVDPNEAELLVGLIESLIREWYIGREERRKRMGAIIEAAKDKTAKQPSQIAASSDDKELFV